jgi:AcrR family transcriptional regulator
MDAIAKRADISRSTLYRHWSNLPELLIAAIEQVSLAPLPALPRDPIARLRIIMHGLGAALRSPRWGMIAAALAEGGTRDPYLAKLHAELTTSRRQPVERTVASAQRAGLIRGDLPAGWIVDALASPLYYHHLVMHEPLSEAQVTEHIDRVLALVLC